MILALANSSKIPLPNLTRIRFLWFGWYNQHDAEVKAPIFWPPDARSWFFRPWCWERLKAGEEETDRGQDGWMASPTWWTWVGASSGRWWKTGKPGVLQSMGLQRVRHNWATEKQQISMKMNLLHVPYGYVPFLSPSLEFILARIVPQWGSCSRWGYSRK